MCGIVGYIGERTAYPILIKGLKLLEYRGYDSAGIALFDSEVNVYKSKGKVSDLEQTIKDKPIDGTVGMGHTRWATHGVPSDQNAHPHVSMNGKFVVVHNGIIENYATLKKQLVRRGYTFQSETDTEVLVNLIESIYLAKKIDAEQAIKLALGKVIGAYGLVIHCVDEPEHLFGTRKGSPLVVGVGDGEYYLGSDATPMVEYTDRIVYLNDDEIAVIGRDNLRLTSVHEGEKEAVVTHVDLNFENIEKGEFEHYMLKEIHEQPTSIMDTLRGRILHEKHSIHLGGIVDVMPRIMKAKRIIIVACGTSYHAGLVGEYLFEDFARIPVEVEYASEFRYRNPVLFPDDVIIAISQSGETADTLAAIRMAKESGALILGICNVVGSSIPRETHAGIYTHAGIEIGVASTKAFTAQVTALMMMAFMLGKRKKTITPEKYAQLVDGLLTIPQAIERVLASEAQIKRVAERYKDSKNAIYLGRGYLFPVALEGALKLKEISYIHAEGYPAAEMKHGPIALIDSDMPVFVLATKDKYYEKIVNNIQEVKARHGDVIAIVSAGDNTVRKMVDEVIEIPDVDEALIPLVAVVPLQIISYYIAVMRGCDVDQPRNLAKSVTVE